MSDITANMPGVSVAASAMGEAMVRAFEALGQEKYNKIVDIIVPLAERDDDNNFTVESMVRLTEALDACTNVANIHSRA